MEFTFKEVTACSVATFMKEAFHKIHFLGIYEIFNITNSSKQDAKCDLNRENKFR